MKNTDDVRRTDTKVCKRCGVEKNLLTCFYSNLLHKEARCKSCVSEIRAARYKTSPIEQREKKAQYRAANPEKIRDTKLRQAYGVGIIYYDAKLKEQGGVCASCGRCRKDTWRGKLVAMPLDHNHLTKQPRGVLCSKCNRALGLVEENIDILLGLIEYIKKYQK